MDYALATEVIGRATVRSRSCPRGMDAVLAKRDGISSAQPISGLSTGVMN